MTTCRPVGCASPQNRRPIQMYSQLRSLTASPPSLPFLLFLTHHLSFPRSPLLPRPPYARPSPRPSISRRLILILTLITPLLLPLRPIQPTPLVIPHILVPLFMCPFRRCRGSLTGPAEEDEVLRGQGFTEGVFLQMVLALIERALVLGDASGSCAPVLERQSDHAVPVFSEIEVDQLRKRKGIRSKG